ncbi:hypothetical protein EX30DRAFT_346073 [Ascodesmis nigricans]|uniref:CoA-binding domain-containing protein n=1 Tax=Ascodesmis nigricans TaxID=341454 RepID=A0A4S2N8J3_9PEZI|nr:hypothetical protein EX30DRAFT_346073 [Ascodesmis nigricans]
MFRLRTIPKRRVSSLTGARAFNSSSLENYAKTLKNLKLTKDTRVMYQGFTGKQSTVNAQQNLQFRTNVVGGVTPGKSGEHLGLPLYSSVREAAEKLKPDASAVFVAAPFAAAAIEDAIAAEIPLVVAVAEHVPVHDMLRIHSILQTQSKTRLVGANAPGILNPGARCRVGFMPHSSFLPGSIGIVAKSGTLSYEAVASTTRAGLGQSTVIGMGGDWVAGTTLAEGVRFFLEDPDTEGIVVIGEIGGSVEMEVAELVRQSKTKKPIMGLVGGHKAVDGYVMGHAGAVRQAGDPTPAEKAKALSDAGVVVVEHPGQFGEGMLKLLGRPRPAQPVMGMGPGNGRRSFHTSSRRRSTGSSEASEYQPYGVEVTIDRHSRSPCVIVTTSTTTHRLPFHYTTGPTPSQLSTLPPLPGLENYITSLLNRFYSTKPYSIALTSIPLSAAQVAAVSPTDAESTLSDPSHNLTLTTFADPATQPGHSPGTIYIPLPSPAAAIGTLVNGAGLAMNTTDVLTLRGGEATNFLDTGGKATAASVKEALETVLKDERVKAVFVNIFGGLTDCIVIAEGVVAGVEELQVEVPVVVRLRGTNEVEGQKVVEDRKGVARGGMWAFSELEDAVAKVVELGGGK